GACAPTTLHAGLPADERSDELLHQFRRARSSPAVLRLPQKIFVICRLVTSPRCTPLSRWETSARSLPSRRRRTSPECARPWSATIRRDRPAALERQDCPEPVRAQLRVWGSLVLACLWARKFRPRCSSDS